ncbi:methylated-DNA--[protein]-cysteine S-methyltransferase [Polluticaenibacter yanchengensis]|uniref:Methylated-DNA--protein-cysteine methyltransferase n=1 Tax=Polluticaenibacter yanchengensis TaxID=3014562 RepID=A0ABT4ULJ1_9BACT|nr:methylated-DNA--[protein]-cysteine S-methyltransferase [Chitinophagaceae bacterium LY-5]
MNTVFLQYYKTDFGNLIIGDFQNRLCLLDWQYRAKREQVDGRIANYLKAEFVEKETPLHQEVIVQLEEYFRQQRTNFDIPLLLAGSDFQKKVWQALLEIPHGQTVSYLSLSRQLGDEKAIRAVASANGANAISIIVPCHRVIGSGGELTGYAGGIDAKKKLLLLEGYRFQPELF